MHKQTHPFTKIISFIFIFGLLGYGLFNTRFILKGPELILEKDNDSEYIINSETSLYTIEGKALHSSFISINNRPITIDENGYFSETFLLSNEINTFVVFAQDKFGKEITKELKVVPSNPSHTLASALLIAPPSFEETDEHKKAEEDSEYIEITESTHNEDVEE